MKFVILCGGIGKRINNFSLPKPLTYINGKHMIEYVIEKIPTNDVHIIYNIWLQMYNFEEIVVNLFKTKTFMFSTVDYLTRGAVETAYVGIINMKFAYEDRDTVVFIDNDNIHDLSMFDININTNFIGYCKNYDNDKTNYSFIQITDNYVNNIEEKIKISDDYCCGIYGFKNAEIFKKYAKKLIDENFKTKNEFYFSQLYKLMLKHEEKIAPVYIEGSTHAGSYNEIKVMNAVINKLRICFDLDNTLVTFPTIPNDYSSVKPIKKMIDLLISLKNKGHEIIIYTARRMKTNNNNVGKVIKDIALVTINTLEKFNIPYDELLFGKPIADIYIDDKAINPYINDISFFGIFEEEKTEYIHNKVENNKYNVITKKHNIIIKNGPYKFIKGELFFYKTVPEELAHYFPQLLDYKIRDNNNIELSLEVVEGIPLLFLYKNKLLSQKHVDELFEVLHNIHTTEFPITITYDNIHNNYFKKLEDRFNDNDYPFVDANDVYESITQNLQKHYSPKIVGILHGDYWFSNIMLGYDDKYKCIDMKGQVDNILTLNGDVYYDYGKLYQSILGYDMVLNGYNRDVEYISCMSAYFIKKCRMLNLNINYLKAVTNSLIFGTFHFIETDESKTRVWEFLKTII
jgi:capsule biosynthesis phosphatase